jgi:hypothetical protein
MFCRKAHYELWWLVFISTYEADLFICSFFIWDIYFIGGDNNDMATLLNLLKFWNKFWCTYPRQTFISRYTGVYIVTDTRILLSLSVHKKLFKALLFIQDLVHFITLVAKHRKILGIEDFVPT